jgi:hypothetical protein
MHAWGASAFMAAALAAGCAADQPLTGGGSVTPSYDRDTGRLERITYDRNGDGRIDATAFMNGTRIVRAELDENFDGVPDRWEHYQDDGHAARREGSDALKGAGVLERVEQATGVPGRVSRWETYAGGVLTAATEDADGDGRVDKWETWSNGSLVAVALDTTGQGRPDRRLLYSPAGGEPHLQLADSSGRFPPDPSTH